jgi:hypothetical protein
MAETPGERHGESLSRSTVLASAIGGVATLALVVLVLFRVLGGVNQAVNNAADEQRERDAQLRRQLEQLGGGRPPVLDPANNPELPDPKNPGPVDRLLAVALRDLVNEDPALRLLAVSAIARRHTSEPDAVAALVKRLRVDKDVEVRLAALRALRGVKPRTPAVEETLRDALKDNDPRVRAEAARE